MAHTSHVGQELCEVRLSEDASEKAVRVVAGNAWVTFEMRGLDGTPAVAGAVATYAGARDADKVAYETVGAGLKESNTLGYGTPWTFLK